MRQAIIVTGLLCLVALPTAYFADDGWSGVGAGRVKPTGTLAGFLKAKPRTMPTTAGVRPIRTRNRQSSSTGEALIGGAVAAVGRFTPGAANRNAGSQAGDDPYLVRPDVWATNPADSAGLDYAADPDGAEARYEIALEYRNRDVDPDPAVAARWLKSAAELGHARAQLDLATMYVEAIGVERNYAAAFMWYTLAAYGLNSTGASSIVVNKRDRLARAMTPEEVADADALIRAWRPKTVAELAPPPRPDPAPAINAEQSSR